ncbi:MAG: hypothetical protein NVSMB5_23320 [Candidatus Velthaea sp.]
MVNDMLAPLGPPYGPPSNLRTIFAAWRDRRMPLSIGREWFERIGLSGNLAPRNLHALRYLGLIDHADAPTPLAERLRVASADEYPAVLERVVRTAYGKVFAVRDPAIDSRARLDDAFRHEKPSAQRSRMVACFVGLCAQAGITLKASPAKVPVGPSRIGRPRAGKTAAPPDAAAPRPGPKPASNALELLVAKFPEFDPAWPERVQELWFENFARLREELLRP